MLKIKKQNKKVKKPYLVIAVIVGIALCVAGGVYAANYFFAPKSLVTADGKTVKLTPATDEEKQQSEELKKSPSTKDDSPAAPSAPSSSVPVITQWGKEGDVVNASGYVQGVFEDGGICTFTFTDGDTNLTKESTGFKNVSSVNCPSVQLPLSSFSQGSWTVTLTYTSVDKKISSASKPQSFTIE